VAAFFYRLENINDNSEQGRMVNMKVAVFVEYFPPKLGSDRRIFEIMKRLSQRHEIHFIVFPPIRMLSEGNQASKATDYSHFHKRIATENHAGITGHFISLSPRITAIWQHSFVAAAFLTLASTWKDTARILGEVRPDILVLNYPSPYTGLLGLTMGNLWGRPVVLDFNDLIAQYTIRLLNIKENGLIAKLLILIQQFIARNAQKVIVPTRFIRDYASHSGVHEKNLIVIPNGVDTMEFDPHRFASTRTEVGSDDHEEKTCYYFGRLDTWAGVNIISRLCDKTKEKRLNVKFILIGSGGSRALCKDNAIFLGEVPHERIPFLLAQADVVLIPFPNNEVSHAASPLKLFEGMAMQKPLIASRVSGVEEVISDGENGFLADPENINEWVEKLQTALTSEALATKVANRARRTVEERYEWISLAKRFEEVLDAATSNHQGSQQMN
jgi:glycosyltransferase involved in cell wall biosynthesis